MRVIKVSDAEIGDSGVYFLSKWWEMEFILDVYNPGGGRAAQVESHCLIECRGKIIYH